MAGGGPMFYRLLAAAPGPLIRAAIGLRKWIGSWHSNLSKSQNSRHWRIHFNYGRRRRAFRVPTLVGGARIPSPAD